jgi:hypothetical protein
MHCCSATASFWWEHTPRCVYNPVAADECFLSCQAESFTVVCDLSFPPLHPIGSVRDAIALQAVSKAAYLMMYARLGVEAQHRTVWPDWSGSLVTPTYVFGKLEGAEWAGHVAGRHWEPPEM